MSSAYESDANYGDVFAIDAALDERAAFISRTYLHLLGAMVMFVGLETLFLTTPAISNALMGLIAGNWMIAIIAFMVVSMAARRMAQSGASTGMQYLGLGLYTVAEAAIFVPLMIMAMRVGGSELILSAGVITLIIFGGLTATVLITKQDFSFLRNFLWMGSFAIMGVIVASFFIELPMGFHLLFTVGVIVLMAGYILYETSNVLHHYRTDQHVAASLALFACVATMLWYVIRLLMMSRD